MVLAMKPGLPIEFSAAFSGDLLQRVTRSLEFAREQLRRAQQESMGPHVDDTLIEADEAIGAQLADLARAMAADAAAREESGEADRERQTWFPTYRAA
jgi:hypothetical protein